MSAIKKVVAKRDIEVSAQDLVQYSVLHAQQTLPEINDPEIIEAAIKLEEKYKSRKSMLSVFRAKLSKLRKAA